MTLSNILYLTHMDCKIKFNTEKKNIFSRFVCNLFPITNTNQLYDFFERDGYFWYLIVGGWRGHNWLFRTPQKSSPPPSI